MSLLTLLRDLSHLDEVQPDTSPVTMYATLCAAASRARALLATLAEPPDVAAMKSPVERGATILSERSAGGDGVSRIAAERQRQIDTEGWTPTHDDEHGKGELLLAAVCYAAPEQVFVRRDYASGIQFRDPWPWSAHWDKRPHDGNILRRPSPEEHIRMLEKAGALIAAEIDRLLRGSSRG